MNEAFAIRQARSIRVGGACALVGLAGVGAATLGLEVFCRPYGSSDTSPVCYLLEPDPETFEPYWLIPGRPDPPVG